MATDLRPEGARVTPAMVGSTTGASRIRWSADDAILYALGVGAGLGDPARELGFTTENSGDASLSVIPSFLSVLAQRAKPPAMAALDVRRLLHGEQRLALYRPLPPAGDGVLVATVTAVFDKGDAALVEIEAVQRESDAVGPAIGRSTMGIFVRGAGGFHGARGTAPAPAPPDRPPDRRIVHWTRPEQALLYRLSGDRHRLHSDPAFARALGFERPILHGLATYGFACRALVEDLAAGDPTRLAAMRGRFRRPVYPATRWSPKFGASPTARRRFAR